MTANYVAYHAAEQPDRVAIISDGRSITYAELHRDSRKFAAAVHELGVVPGDSIAIGCDDPYVDLLLLLACERLGVASATLLRREGPSALALLASVSLVLSARAYPPGAAKRHHAITRDWTRSVLDRAVIDDPPVPASTPEDIVRIGRTSGTTGDSKRLAFPRRQRDARITSQIWGARLAPASRCLVHLPFGMNTSYVFAMGALRSGATLISDRGSDTPRAIAAHAVTHMVLLPIQLRTLLESLPADFEKPAELTVISVGAPVSEVLRERAITRLASRLCDLYGTQEIGNIAWRTSSGTGGVATVWPGVQVEVVDDADMPLPIGQAGRLRVRAQYMVQGYADDPEETQRKFRDGWFYSGDMAVLHDPNRLELIGRSDDLLNIGGAKMPPSSIEELIVRTVGAKDAGVCTVRNPHDIDEIWIGVTDCPLGDPELIQRLEQALKRLQVGTFRVMRLHQLPRNANGKIQRDALRATMLAAAGRSPD
jgi:acyl-coenzyme A synthetase/AMP-(fatty) acid ligase